MTLPLPVCVPGKCASEVDPYDDYNAHLTSTSPAFAVSRATSSSAWLGLVIVVCLFSLTAFCLVFGLLQAHSHELLCWKQHRTLYQPVPIFYHHHKGAIGVRLGRHHDTVTVDSENSDEHLYQNSPNHHKGAIGVRLGRHRDTVTVDSETSDEHLYQNSPNHREVA